MGLAFPISLRPNLDTALRQKGFHQLHCSCPGVLLEPHHIHHPLPLCDRMWRSKALPAIEFAHSISKLWVDHHVGTDWLTKDWQMSWETLRASQTQRECTGRITVLNISDFEDEWQHCLTVIHWDLSDDKAIWNNRQALEALHYAIVTFANILLHQSDLREMTLYRSMILEWLSFGLIDSWEIHLNHNDVIQINEKLQ